MSSVAQVAAALQAVLTETAAAAGRSTGFVTRAGKLDGASFVQTLVFGWLADPAASLHQLTQIAAALGVAISPQALDQRFTRAAATLLERVLAAAAGAAVAADPVAVPLLRRFAGVLVQDSTTVALPDALAEVWPGCGGRTAEGTAAAVKLQVRLDLVSGHLDGPLPTPGRAQDKTSSLQTAPVVPESLRLQDLGYWSLPVLRVIGEQGGYWLSRLPAQVTVFDATGTRLDLPRWLAAQAPTVDGAVTLGVQERLPARLLVVRVPQAVADERRRKLRAEAQREGKTPSAARLALAAWTLFVTNVPTDRLSVAEALVLGRARWQIELLFKLWKRDGRLDESRSGNPERVLCEVYAKLIALVVQHWCCLTGRGTDPAHSRVQAAQTVRAHAPHLASALRHPRRLRAALRLIQSCLAVGCRLNRRKTYPNTFQLLLHPLTGGLA